MEISNFIITTISEIFYNRERKSRALVRLGVDDDLGPETKGSQINE